MSTSRILSECLGIQAPLNELFREVGQAENLPLAQFVLSPENSSMIVTDIAPSRGSGKLQDVTARWVQRLPESEVEEGADIETCTATNSYGDSTQTYTLDTTDNIQWKAKVNKVDIARHCQENSRYIYETILRGMSVMDRKFASVLATQVVAQHGGWGTETAEFFTIASDKLQLQTMLAEGKLNPFFMPDVLQASQMANYPANPIMFGGAAVQRAANAYNAGCCGADGLNIIDIARQNQFGYAYDARLAAALGGQEFAMLTVPGAIQWLSLNFANWRAGLTLSVGTDYATTLVYTPSGLPVDLTLKDDCGNLSIIMTAIGKAVTLPLDIYEASDKYAGINYVNLLEVVDPS